MTLVSAIAAAVLRVALRPAWDDGWDGFDRVTLPPGLALVEFLFWLVKGLLDSPAEGVTLTEHAGRQGHFISQEAVDFVAVGSAGGKLALGARGVFEGNGFVADDQLLGWVSTSDGPGAGSYRGEVVLLAGNEIYALA